jgi:hypothetical protein
MNKDDVIAMYKKANGWSPEGWDKTVDELERFAALIEATQREKVAAWMMQRGYATGHGDTIDDLLSELSWQIAEGWNRALMNGVKTEREVCAELAAWILKMPENDVSAAIRARGQND